MVLAIRCCARSMPLETMVQALEVVQLGRPIVKPAPHHIEELKEYEAQLA